MTDKEYYQLTISISKALSGIEMPLKVKHARAAIIGTFHTQGAHSFWAITLRQPLQENRITAWKFCHLLHKVLREGHPLCCQHSMRHRNMLTELGKLWGHLNDGYGLCIRHYTKLLVTKLEFHDRNPRFPGHLALKRGELEIIAGNDINFYFELAVEMFDYLDDIIALQATIFNSITTFHVNSMTSAGQCRLAPLIPLIQDSNPLYDFVVRVMFKLHANLPNDVLVGHRDRFRAIFTQLKSFYNQSRNLQYFVNLITVPKLPENAPNFTSQVEFGSYTAPVVVIPEPDPEPEPDVLVDNLVDMATPVVHHRPPPPPQPVVKSEPQIDYERIIHDRDDLIMHLQTEVDRLGKCLKMVANEHREERAQFEENVATLHSHLSDAQEELVNMRFVKEELELKAQSAEKVQAEEEKVKAYEEKFTKLKTMYGQIREEHVKLLRQHGDVKKHMATLTKTTGDLTKEKDEALSKLDEIRSIQNRAEESLQKSSAQLENEKHEYLDKIQMLQNENSMLTAKFDDLNARNEAQHTEFVEMKMNLEQQLTNFEEINQHCKQENSKLNEGMKTVQETLLKTMAEVQMKTVTLENLERLVFEKSRESDNLQKNANQTIETNSQLNSKITTLQQENLKLNEDMKAVQEILSKTMAEVQMKTVTLENLERLVFEKSRESDNLQKNANQTIETNNELNLKIIKLQCDFEELTADYAEVKQNNILITNDRRDLELNLVVLTNEKDELQQHLEISNQQIELLKNQINEQIQMNDAQKLEFSTQLEDKSVEIATITNSLNELESKYEQLRSNTNRMHVEKNQIETDLQDLLHEQEEMKEKYEAALSTVAALESSLIDVKIREESRLRALMEACVKSSEKLVTRAISENEVVGARGTSVYFTMVAEELQNVLNQLVIVHDNYLTDSSNVEGFARKVILGGHLIASVHVQGTIICNSSADIDAGEKISEEIKKWSNNVQDLFTSLCTKNESNLVKSRIEEVKIKLQEITTMIHDLSKKSDGTEIIGDIIENELANMDKAIEEAASNIEQMLSKSRQSDSGIKLEVNEKILDACTALMNYIRVLVQKSRKLQAEIVSLGKGSASAKEFYKRNHQWTEGLISAAKSVAQGANFLVTAANKTVSGESKHQLDLIVAAQEIAACTAQLVVSSRVKAPRESSNLCALGQASRDVTQATGAVVATVKDCGQRLEDSQDMDLTNLSVHQAKTLEMEIQVKVLELEQALQVARSKLAAFRRKNYRES